MTEGLTSTGLVVDTTDQTLTKIEGDELATIDPALNTAPTQPLGQMNGIYASDRAGLAQLIQAIYNALDPNSAEGQQLDVVGALRGNKRKPATSTRVVAQCSLDKGHVFAAATLDANGNVVSNGALVAQIAGHPEFVFTAIGLYQPGGVSLVEAIDTTAAVGTASYQVIFVCTQTGPIACNAGTLTVISPAVGGWNSVTNPNDASSLGAPIETDAAYRVRQLAELVPAGGGTFESLLESLLAVTGTGAGNQGVISAQLLVNDTDATDANGVPPHAFEAVIWDGASPQAADNDIAQALWNAKPAGVRAFGTTTATALDSTGAQHTLGFTRATQDAYYIAISIKTNTLYPTNGDTLLAAALVAFGNALGTGAEVDLFALGAQALTIAGVRTVSTIKCDTSVTPSNTADIATLPTHIARFDSARVTVTHV